MAVSATHRETSSSATDTNSYATSSLASTSGALMIAYVYTEAASADLPALTSTHGTWVNAASHATGATARLSMHYCYANGNTGAITISFATTQLRCLWSVTEFSNIKPSDPFAQIDTRTSGFVTNPSITLSAFEDTLNATLGGIVNSDSRTYTPGGAFAELGETADTETAILETEWVNSNQTTVDWTSSGFAIQFMIACEIREVNAVVPSGAIVLAVSD